MLGIEERSRVLHELAARAVPDVDIWPALNGRFWPARRHADKGRIWRWAALVTAAIAVTAVIALGLVPSLSTPEAVSAETILDRAELAGSTPVGVVSTYHLSMTRVAKD